MGSICKKIFAAVSFLAISTTIAANECEILPGGCLLQPEGKMIPHADLKTFTHHGNAIQGVANSALGSAEFEVWRTSLAVGGKTPLHTHESEEIFIVLKGKGKALIGNREVLFEAPCTVICPAYVPHQLINTGDEPTDSILVLKTGSKIVDAAGDEMDLPWRKLGLKLKG